MRAKFRLNSITDHGNQKQLKFAAVTSGSDENKDWAKYTPCGSIEMSVDNLAAVEGMKPGDEFYLVFTKAGSGEAG